jgi:hypothetical protein
VDVIGEAKTSPERKKGAMGEEETVRRAGSRTPTIAPLVTPIGGPMLEPAPVASRGILDRVCVVLVAIAKSSSSR